MSNASAPADLAAIIGHTVDAVAPQTGDGNLTAASMTTISPSSASTWTPCTSTAP